MRDNPIQTGIYNKINYKIGKRIGSLPQYNQETVKQNKHCYHKRDDNNNNNNNNLFTPHILIILCSCSWLLFQDRIDGSYWEEPYHFVGSYTEEPSGASWYIQESGTWKRKKRRASGIRETNGKEKGRSFDIGSWLNKEQK